MKLMFEFEIGWYQKAGTWWKITIGAFWNKPGYKIQREPYVWYGAWAGPFHFAYVANAFNGSGEPQA